jgi:hypothetical protein
MAWILTVAFFAFMYGRVMKAQECPIECAPTGMLRSPLYWTGMGLVGVLLLGLAFTERYVLRLDAIFIWAWFAALAITVIALLIVRRALKWRYPV